MGKMGKYAAKQRFEQQHTTKSGKRDAGGRWRSDVTRDVRFQIDCVSCGYSYRSDHLTALCPKCISPVLIVTDLSTEND